MATTPVYGLPYQTLDDPPNGAALGLGLAEAVETELVRIDQAAAQPAIAWSTGVSEAGPASANTTTSSTYVSLTGTSSATITKSQGTATQLRIDLSVSSWCNGTLTLVRFGVLVNGVDYDVTQIKHADSGKHAFATGTAYISGLAAGSYTIQARWRRVTGTGTLTRDIEDWLSLAVTEVDS